MGGGSSRAVLAREQKKPIDASDLPFGDWETAKNEVARMRELLHLIDPTSVPDNITGGNAGKAGRQQIYEPQLGSPSGGSGGGEPDPFRRSDRLKTPPDLSRRPGGNKPDTASETGETDSKSNQMSREGKDYWANSWANNPQSPSPTGNNRPETGADPKSNAESDAGQDYWNSLRDRDTGIGGGTGRLSTAKSSTGRSTASGPFSPKGGSGGGPDSKRLLEEIRSRTFQRYNGVREAFLKVDYDRSGYISREEFRTALANWGLPLTDEEFDVVNESYPHKEAYGEVDKGIGYLEFITLMTDQLGYIPGEGEGEAADNYYGNTTQNTAYAVASTPSRATTARPYTSSLRSNSSAGSGRDRGDLTRMQNVFSKKLFGKYHSMKDAFKAADTDGSGFIEIGEFAKLLWDQLEIRADEDQVLQMMGLFDTNGDGRLAYAEFVKCLHTY